MENLEIKIDYFSATFPLDVDADDSIMFKVHEMVRLIATYLNIKNFEILKTKFAQNNYNYQFQLGEFITLRLDGPMNDCYQKTCHIEMKGEGCRDFEVRNPDKTWVNFILFMAELNCRFKRIDIAIDDFKGEHVTLGWLMEKFSKKHYTSVFRSEAQPHGTIESGLSIQFGSTESPIQLVIYDKKAERKKRKKVCDKTYWVRYEMRFRNETADRMIYQLCKEYENPTEFTGCNLQNFAFKQLYRIMDIKEDNNYDVKMQHKVNTDKRWLDFLQNVDKGILPKLEETVSKTFEDYMKAAQPYIVTWLLVRYLSVLKDPYLFEMEIFKFMRDELALSKKRFQRLNIFLNQMHLKTIDDAELALLKTEFAGIIDEKELPF